MAQNLLGLAHILFLSLENTLPGPAAKSWRAGGQTALYQYLAKACSGGTVGMALFLVLISVGAEPVFQLLFGAVPPNTQWIVMGYAVVYALTFLAIPLRVALRTVGKSRAQFLAYVASMLFSVATAVPMLKAWGLTGLFVGLIGCQLIQLAVYGWDLTRDASSGNEALERDKPL
jgi:O-antigen/teichoic acid export membrane protein